MNRPLPAFAVPSPGGEELALVAGCRAGDRASLDRFFRTYVSYVERVIVLVLGPSSDL